MRCTGARNVMPQFTTSYTTVCTEEGKGRRGLSRVWLLQCVYRLWSIVEEEKGRGLSRVWLLPWFPVLRCLDWLGNEIWFVMKKEESKKLAATGNQTRAPGSSYQCSNTKLWPLENCWPSQSSVCCTGASVTPLPVTSLILLHANWDRCSSKLLSLWNVVFFSCFFGAFITMRLYLKWSTFYLLAFSSHTLSQSD